MKTSLDTLLNELYELDGSLREREGELRSVIETMLKSKPDTEFSPEFYEDLRDKLLKRIRQLGAKADTPSSPISFFAFLRPWGLVATAFVLGLLPSAYFYFKNNVPPSPSPVPESVSESTENIIDFAPEIIAVEKDAFGTNFISLQIQDQKAFGMGGGSGAADAKLMDPENMISYEFVYEGDIPLPETPTLPVYKRMTHENGVEFANMLSKLGLGVIDAGSFPALAFQSVSLAQSTPFGYILNADLLMEQISLNPNYTKWPNPLQQCWGEGVAPEVAQKCQEDNSLQMEDVPQDPVMIAAAQEFLNAHGVDTAKYGQPYVNDEWRREYERMASEMNRNSGSTDIQPPLPIPEQIPVVFTLLTENKPVYEGTRGNYGINVAYDIRHKRIGSVFNLATQRYEKSEYTVVSDTAKLAEMLKQGGLYRTNFGEGGETRQIRLNDPEIALVRHTEFKDEKMTELLIPALIFSISPQEGTEMLFQDKVVLPLVKGIEINAFPLMPLTDEVPVRMESEAQSSDFPAPETSGRSEDTGDILPKG